MKKALIALAVLGLTGGAAVAQSSVTLFGVVDAGVKYVKANGQNISRLDSGGMNTSRFGLRGTEDLGGGLKAGFWLESQINADTGTADTVFWGRRATVSLMGDFGEVRLGRDKTVFRQHTEEFDPTTFTGLGSVKALYSVLGSGNATPFDRADNNAAYYLPGGLGGFYGGVNVAAGEGGATANKNQAVRLGYKSGPLHVSGAYISASNAADSAKYKGQSIGASYDFGFVKPSFVYTQGKYGSAKQTLYTVAATAPLGQGVLFASYTKANANAAAESATGVARIGDADLIAAGYRYSLSKRTALYTTVSRISNKGLNKAGVSGSPAVAVGGNSGGVDVGISHSF